MSEEAVRLLDRIARVNADPDPDRGRVIGKRRRHVALNCLSTCDCASRARKRKHRAVSLCLDDRAAVDCRDVPDERVVASQDLSPRVIAEARREDGRIDDVGEDDRDRAVDRERCKEIWLLAFDGSLERLEADREFPAEEIHIRLRQ